MSGALAWTALIPLAGATLAFLVATRWRPLVGLIVSIATLVPVAMVIWLVLDRGTQYHPVAGWGVPLGIELAVDGLSAVMLGMCATVGVFVSWYAWSYFEPPSASTTEGGDTTSRSRWTESDSFWPLWLFLWSALNVIFLSSDVFNIYVGLEIMGLAAVALVILAGQPAALVAGMRYLLSTLIGSLCWLMGVAILYAAYGTLDIQLLGERLDQGPAALAALVLMTVGLMLKTALFPLHFWLPAAHSNAPSPVSAVLSALVVKASFYLLLRLWTDVFPGVLTIGAGQLIGVVASIAIIWGSVQAIRQSRLKLLVAYSTVAQIGYFFLMVPLMLPTSGPISDLTLWTVSAWEGGIYQVVSHAFAKAAMFLAAGSIMLALHHSDDIDAMEGVASGLPITTLTFGLASVSLMGLPPSGGFAAKWLLLTASVETGQWWWAAVLIVGGLLTAVYLFKFLGQTFRPAESNRKLAHVPLGLELPALLLAILAFFSGLLASYVFDLLEIGLVPLQ